MDFLSKKVLTFKEGCAYLGYAKSYVYKLTSSKVLPFSKPNGKFIFFDRHKLDDWMLSNESSSYKEIQVKAATYLNTNQIKFKRKKNV